MSHCWVLIGFKACGKTSVGQLLAQQLQAKFIDTDRLLEANYPVPITCAELYRTLGMRAFRALEKKVIMNLAQATPGETRVIATGGGAVLDAENRAHLARLGTIIYLFTSYAQLLPRLHHGKRPAFMSGDLASELQCVFAERERIYRDMAHLVCDTDDHSVTEVVALLTEELCGQ